MQKLAPFLVVNRTFIEPKVQQAPDANSALDGARALFLGVAVSLPFWVAVIWAVWKGWWIK